MYFPNMENTAVVKGTTAGLALYNIRAFDYMAMRDHIEEKYGIKERDYKNKWGFKWVEHAVSLGATPKEAKTLYNTAPANIKDERLKLIHDACAKASQEWADSHPYCDFWHFLLDYFVDFSRGKPMYLNWANVLEYAEEDWQKEIAQLYVNEYGDEEYVVVIDW